MTEHGFSHFDETGMVRMVDVGGKKETERLARAVSMVVLNQATFKLLLEKAIPKGDVFTTAQIAGIMAAKRVPELIPLCHPLSLTSIDVRFTLDSEKNAVRVEAEARSVGKTGVEMEALTAVQVAALTIYDMCKAVQKDICITDCRLVHKQGGKSGEYNATSL